MTFFAVALDIVKNGAGLYAGAYYFYCIYLFPLTVVQSLFAKFYYYYYSLFLFFVRIYMNG